MGEYRRLIEYMKIGSIGKKGMKSYQILPKHYINLEICCIFQKINSEEENSQFATFIWNFNHSISLSTSMLIVFPFSQHKWQIETSKYSNLRHQFLFYQEQNQLLHHDENVLRKDQISKISQYSGLNSYRF